MGQGEADVWACRRVFDVVAACKVSLVALLVLLMTGSTAYAQPKRIVSLNFCADLLLLQLADRSRIASLTHLVSDSELSMFSKVAENISLNHGTAEEVLRYDPDLVISGSLTALPTAALLRRLGVRVVTIQPASNFDEIRNVVNRVAKEIGETERGRVLISKMDFRLSLITPSPSNPERAIVYQPHGYTAGSGTLADEIIRAAGMTNAAAELGIVGYQQVSLETLVGTGPDWLVTSSYRPEQPSLSGSLMEHPVLHWREGEGLIALPPKYWACGNPIVVDAVERLAKLRKR